MSGNARFHDVCANCGTALTGPYCAHCGQKDQPDELSTEHMWHEVAHELFHADGRIAATLRVLLLQPGRITREYLDGRRMKYVPPLRLYLICSAIYFLVTPVFTSLAREIHPLPTAARADSCPGLTIKESALGVSIAPAKPGEPLLQTDADTTTFRGRLIAHAARVACHPDAFEHAFLSALPKLFFLYLPVFAFLMELVYRDRGMSYAAHLIFALHFHAMLFIVLIVSGVFSIPGSVAVGSAAGAVGVVYTSWQIYAGTQRAYGGTSAETVWKTTLVGLLYGVLFLAGLMALLAVLLVRA